VSITLIIGSVIEKNTYRIAAKDHLLRELKSQSKVARMMNFTLEELNNVIRWIDAGAPEK